jgi:hypothetical protein
VTTLVQRTGIVRIVRLNYNRFNKPVLRHLGMLPHCNIFSL